jgi:hypothetical protein
MIWSLILASQNSRRPGVSVCFFGGKSDRSKNLSVTVRESSFSSRKESIYEPFFVRYNAIYSLQFRPVLK